MAFNETVFNEIMKQMPPEMAGKAAPFFFFMGPIILLAILFSVLLMAVWIWMIIDCAKRNKFRSGDRVVWILLLVLLGLIGMILYYFMVMRED